MHYRMRMLGLGVKTVLLAAFVLASMGYAADPPATTTSTTVATQTAALGQAQTALTQATAALAAANKALIGAESALAEAQKAVDEFGTRADEDDAEKKKTLDSNLTAAKAAVEAAKAAQEKAKLDEASARTRVETATAQLNATRALAVSGARSDQQQQQQQQQNQQRPQVVVVEKEKEKEKKQEEKEQKPEQKQAQTPSGGGGGGGEGMGSGSKPQNVTSEIAAAALAPAAKIANEIGKNDVSKTLIEKPKDVGVVTSATPAPSANPATKGGDTLVKQISDGAALLTSSIKLPPMPPRGRTNTSMASSGATVGSQLGASSRVAVKKTAQITPGRSPLSQSLASNPVNARSGGSKSGYVPTSRLLGFYNPAVEGSTRGAKTGPVTNRAIRARRPASAVGADEDDGGEEESRHQQ